MSFDDPVRIAASLLYNIPLHYFSDAELFRKRIPQLDMTPEKLMNVIASDVCQGLRRSVWNDRLLLRMSAVSMLEPSAPPPKVVVSGISFEEEADFVRSLEPRQSGVAVQVGQVRHPRAWRHPLG